MKSISQVFIDHPRVAWVICIVISLCGCYFGIKTGRNADSVGLSTTKAVVFSIAWMIVMTGIITLICEVMGI
jgi:phospholipid/cholesterol/gamma-HCH transport system permease protein